jgi:hypothetical protein
VLPSSRFQPGSPCAPRGVGPLLRPDRPLSPVLFRDGRATGVVPQFVVAPTFLRFVLINGLTFGVDLLLLSGLQAGPRMPIPFAVYLAAVLANYLAFILGLSSAMRWAFSVGDKRLN